MAYGPMGLKPWELAELTPGEFRLLAEGAVERMGRERELAAWIVMYLANASGNLKQLLTMQDLLGPEWALRQLQRDALREEKN